MVDSEVKTEGGDGEGSSEVIATVDYDIGGFEVRRWIVYNIRRYNDAG